MGYLIQALEPHNLRMHAQSLTCAIETYNSGYDAIAVSGNSGSIMAGILSINLDKPIIVVRKGESCHGEQVELPSLNWDGTNFTEQPRRYIIVDDGISSGATIQRILSNIGTEVVRMNEVLPEFDLLCTGIFCYNQEFIGTMNKGVMMELVRRFQWTYPIVCNNQLLYNP